MNRFELHTKVEKEKIKTKFGVVSIRNIKFDSTDIQKILPDIIFEDNNLKFMFQKDAFLGRDKVLVLKRFLPNKDVEDITKFIIESINSNKTFYSFLAEGMLGLVFRDIYGYDLSVGIIDITETLTDTHTGSDACMFDKKENVLVLGEAKFYESLNNGMKSVISDFLTKNIFNKLDSFKRKIEQNDDSWKIVVKNLKVDTYDFVSLSDFMQQKIFFAGFVLHNNEVEMEDYLKSNFYDDFSVNVGDLKNNIKKCIESDNLASEYEIFLFHLPIRDKKTLIKEIMKRASLIIDQLRGDG